jgi:ligand-binding sensor domain-containing protein
VQEISALNDSVIAIASFAKGFFLFNPRQKTVLPLNLNQGLPSNIAKGIETDRQGNLWIAMLSDLIRMNPVTKKNYIF